MAIKPVVSAVGNHAQPTFAFAPAAKTDLPGTKAVAPVIKNDPTRNEPKPAQSKSTTRDAIIDPETSEVVYRVLDAHTRRVLHQEPDQAMLRMQAYARTKAACALASGDNIAAATQAAIFHVDAIT